METTSPEIEATSPEMKTTSPKMETTSPEIEASSAEIETTSPEMKTDESKIATSIGISATLEKSTEPVQTTDRDTSNVNQQLITATVHIQNHTGVIPNTTNADLPNTVTSTNSITNGNATQHTRSSMKDGGSTNSYDTTGINDSSPLESTSVAPSGTIPTDDKWEKLLAIHFKHCPKCRSRGSTIVLP